MQHPRPSLPSTALAISAGDIPCVLIVPIGRSTIEAKSLEKRCVSDIVKSILQGQVGGAAPCGGGFPALPGNRVQPGSVDRPNESEATAGEPLVYS